MPTYHHRLVPTLALLGCLAGAAAADPVAHYQGTDRRRIVVELNDRLTDMPQDWRQKLQVWHYNAPAPRGADGKPRFQIPEREAVGITNAELIDGRLVITLAERASMSTRVFVDGVTLTAVPANVAAGLKPTTSLAVARIQEDAAFDAQPGPSGIVNLADRFTLSYTTGDVANTTPGIKLAQGRNVLNMDQVNTSWPEIDGSGGETNANDKFSVAVLDSGVDASHSFFAGRVVYSGNFTPEGGEDGNGHGTHVAGIIGSSNGTHKGIAHGVNIIGLKVLRNNGSGSNDGIAKALEWCVQNADRYNIIAINMSLGGGFSQTPGRGYATQYFNELRKKGILPVVATGNEFYEVGSALGVGYPAFDPGAFGVGATYDARRQPTEWGGAEAQFVRSIDVDRVCFFTNRHPTMLRVMAPGSLITSARTRGGTETMQGTSQASPMVAGLVAMAQDLAKRKRGKILSVGELSALLRSTGTNIKDGDDEDDIVRNTNMSWPRVDGFKLFSAIDDGGGDGGGGGGGSSNPTINVLSEPDVCIEGRTQAAFVITSTPAPSEDKTIAFRLSGTASNGTDFTTVTETVILPAGSTAVEVVIDPLTDSEVEPPETVNISIASGSYIIGSRRSATITIRDEDTEAPNQGPMMMVIEGRANADVISVSIGNIAANLGSDKRWVAEVPVSNSEVVLRAITTGGQIEERPLRFTVTGQGGAPSVPGELQ
jgi:hypothetical protein